MPGTVLERPKLTKAMYGALKKHIMKEREKKKQGDESSFSYYLFVLLIIIWTECIAIECLVELVISGFGYHNIN